MERPEYRLLTETGAARAALDELLHEKVIGLDTETCWNSPENRSRISLIQFAPPAGAVIIIDALAVDPEILRLLVESPETIKVAHNARFDEMVLAGAGMQPAALVDTLSLARMALFLPSYSLAAVAAELFGIALDKSLQKSNWGRRPLTRAQIEYAAVDARATLLVYQELCRRLTDEGRLDEALRIATLKPSARHVPRKKRILQPLSPPLTKEEKRTVARLKKWRLERANTGRLPAYMICPDRTLECLARERPATLAALHNIYGLGESKIASYGEELLGLLHDKPD